MLYEVLSEIPQHVLPLPCNAYVSVTSERRQGDDVTVSHNYPIAYYCRTTFEQIDKNDEIYAKSRT